MVVTLHTWFHLKVKKKMSKYFALLGVVRSTCTDFYFKVLVNVSLTIP